MGYGYLLKQARVDRGWSITRAAERLELGRSYYAHMEADRILHLRPEILEKLEDVLGVPREDIARAAGLIGPAPPSDAYDEFKRLADLPDNHARKEALRRLPPDVVQAIEILGLTAAQSRLRRARQSKRQGP